MPWHTLARREAELLGLYARNSKVYRAPAGGGADAFLDAFGPGILLAHGTLEVTYEKDREVAVSEVARFIRAVESESKAAAAEAERQRKADADAAAAAAATAANTRRGPTSGTRRTCTAQPSFPAAAVHQNARGRPARTSRRSRCGTSPSAPRRASP